MRPHSSADNRKRICTPETGFLIAFFALQERNRTESFAHKMPPGVGKSRKGPRSIAGGYSARHDERSASRGVKKQHAPSWNDATASIFMEELKKVAGDASGRLGKKAVLDLFREPAGIANVVKQACARLVARDRELVESIVESAKAKLALKIAAEDWTGVTKSQIRLLRRRRCSPF